MTLKDRLKPLLNQTLKPFGIGIINSQFLQQLLEKNLRGSRAVEDIEVLLGLPDEHSAQLLRLLSRSRAQLRQDLVVLSELEFKRNGYFIEFGAANGVELSNTYLLEKDFGWCGILAEPAKRWHKDLRNNRTCHIETDCVWRDSNSTVSFNEVESWELSTIDSFSSSDQHSQARKDGKTYEVRTISLEDLLEKYKAPKKIDYLSIDTEGSEYEILRHFNFDKYQFKVITCEHNFQPVRENIYALLTGKGYVRKFEGISQFDDWYLFGE